VSGMYEASVLIRLFPLRFTSVSTTFCLTHFLPKKSSAECILFASSEIVDEGVFEHLLHR
jgi:hypothetical protein